MERETLTGRLARAARAFNTVPEAPATIQPLAGYSASLPRPALVLPASARPSGRRGAYAGVAATRLEGDWLAGSQPPDVELHYEAKPLRARARELRRNTPIVRRYLGLLAENIVGPEGFGHQPQVRDESGNLDKRTNQIIADAWYDFCSEAITLDGRQSMLEFAHLSVKSVAGDGELLIRKVVDRSLRHGLALQGIDADVLDESTNQQPGRGQPEIRMGVEIDDVGRRMGYWLRHRDYMPGGRRFDPVRVPAGEILHLFLAERVNQTRGVTWLAPIMGQLHNLRGYVEAHLMAARVASSQMGWLQYQKDADPPASDPDAPATDPDAERQPLQFEMEPAMVRELPYGMEFQPWAPEYPNTSYAEFVKACERWIASGLEVSYTSLGNDLEGVNFSSIRAGLLAERDHWRLLQQLWIDWFLTPVYRTWLRTSYLSGALALPTPFIERYTAVRWNPRRWPWVDPLKDIQAVREELDLNLNSEQRVAAEHGRDYLELLEERAEAQRQARKLGLAPKPAAPAVPPKGDEADPDEKDEPDPDDAGEDDELEE